VILAPIHSARAATLSELAAAAKAVGAPAVAAETVSEALQLAQDRAAQVGGPVVITGSVFLVGEARTLLLGARGRQP